MTDTGTDSQPPQPRRRRRRHHRSPAARLARFLGIDRSRSRAALLVAAVGILVVAGAVALTNRPSPDGTAAASPAAAGATQTTGATPGTQPAAATLPAVATIAPIATPTPKPAGIVASRIRVDRLGIGLRIVEGDGIDAPLNKAAHYPGSGWPGGGTNIYLYAHAQTGMFLALWNAQVGDDVSLDLVDGTTRQYQVTQVLPTVAWNAMQYTAATPTEQLTLQTSTSYTATAPRFVVIAEPAP